jgi:hypothetical protein
MKGNPYVGPRPYERGEQQNFYGREREARDLLSLILAERVVLFYAPSGAGKTSLLNAKIISGLEEEGFQVLDAVRVGSDLPPDVEPHDVDNVFVFSALMGLAGEDFLAENLTDHTLLSFLRRQGVGQEAGPSIREDGDVPWELDTCPPILIVDQFEELFTTHRDRWQDATGFFEQVREALREMPILGLVLTMREDRVAELDPYAHHLPGRLRARFRMERLDRDGALAAVTKPAEKAGCPFDAGVAERLVDDLRRIKRFGEKGRQRDDTPLLGPYVEPVQLQVVCQSLWRGLPADAAVITGDHLRGREVDQALLRFYERSIKWAVEKSSAKEADLRRWFDRELITPAGTRGTVYRGPEKTGRISNTTVDELENLHLIRGEQRAGARWYELTHDRFIEPIQRANEEWRFVQSLGIPENREKIIDYAREREQEQDWDGAERAYERLLDEARGEEEERWTLARDGVRAERKLASLYARAQGAIESKRWTQASKDLDEIREKRPDYEDVAHLDEQVKEERQKRKRLALLNALIVLGTTALLGYLSGVWLAGRLAARMNRDLALYQVGGVAAMCALAGGVLFAVPEYGTMVDLLDVRGVRKKHIAHIVLRMLSILGPWFVAELMILFIGLLGWGAGALTLWVFGRFTGFYVMVWVFGILFGVGSFGLVAGSGIEPSDPPS